jgi:hypothetical protein
MGKITMNDEFLKKHNKNPRPDFAQALYKRISKTMNVETKTYRPRRLALASVLTLVILAGLVLSLPAAQAFASSLMRQIGAVVLIDQSGGRGEVAMPPAATAVPFTTAVVHKVESTSEIAQYAGYQPATPVDLPEGYEAAGSWSIVNLGEGFSAYREYRNASGSFLIYNAVKHDEGVHFEQTYGDNEQLTDVTVRGQAGVWLTGRYVGQTEGSIQPTNWLMWAEEGVNYTLYSDTLSLAEMMAVAENLK